MAAILHLIDTTGPGGAEDVFISLADTVREHGYRSIAVIRGEGYVHNRLSALNVKTYIIPSKGSFNFSFIFQLCKIVKKEKIGLIQSHLLGSNVYSSILGMIMRIPVIAVYHGMVDISPTERFRKIKHWVMKRGISHYVTVSKALREQVEKNQLLDLDKTSVIYNGIDLSRYSQKRSERIKSDLSVTENEFLIGTLGNIRKPKRYDLLVEAINLVNKERSDLHFVIAGDEKPSLKQALDAQIVSLGIKNIHFLGFIENTADYLSNLDGYVLTSSSEGLSISTIEAMACGLPVVATKCGGPEEIITNDEQGILVEVNDPKSIAKGILALCDNLAKAKRLNTAGRERVQENYSLDVMLAQYVQLYREFNLLPTHSKLMRERRC